MSRTNNTNIISKETLKTNRHAYRLAMEMKTDYDFGCQFGSIGERALLDFTTACLMVESDRDLWPGIIQLDDICVSIRSGLSTILSKNKNEEKPLAAYTMLLHINNKSKNSVRFIHFKTHLNPRETLLVLKKKAYLIKKKAINVKRKYTFFKMIWKTKAPT